MCGRAAQTVHVAQTAVTDFGAIQIRPPPNARTRQQGNNNNNNNSNNNNNNNNTNNNSTEQNNADASNRQYHEARDNFNMSPGMDATVIWIENGKLQMGRKVWGLVNKGGTAQHPLPSDSKERMGMHFAGLMYNARTDTLFTKPSFSRLAKQNRACLVALDGYFEWKVSPLAGGKGKKQPYFVHKKPVDNDKSNYLLMAGLWNRVPTGLSEEPYLDTFTVLTTEACQQISWLHHRMPVCIWDTKLAHKWLNDPSPKTLEEVDQAAQKKLDGFAWHMVTTEMSSVKFRDKEAILPKKGPVSVSAFFSKSPGKVQSKSTEPTPTSIPSSSGSSNNNNNNNCDLASFIVKQEMEIFKLYKPPLPKSPPIKREAPESTKLPPSKKAKSNKEESPKKGLITSFFQQKR